ncbi:hypothetical protein EV175_001850 [Coemansia sp. RSA 1933]|nr:hypothetical protein EV175_001850 [Coemansia sp. RSA 1933]
MTTDDTARNHASLTLPPSKRIQPTTLTPSKRIQPQTPASEWTADEKDQVLTMLAHGRLSPIEIVRRLDNKKSLRQVTEFLDYLEFWSNALDCPAARHKRRKLAAADVTVTYSNVNMVTENRLLSTPTVCNNQEDCDEHQELLVVGQNKTKNNLFSLRYLRLLMSIITATNATDDDGPIPGSIGNATMTELRNCLIRFLSPIIGDIVARTKIASSSANRRSDSEIKVSGTIARLSLAACCDHRPAAYATAPALSPAQVFADLLDRYSVDLSDQQNAAAESGGDGVDSSEDSSDELAAEPLDHWDPPQSPDPEPSFSPQLSNFVVYDDPVYYFDSPPSSTGLPSDDESG